VNNLPTASQSLISSDHHH
jgi:hypothetical protein